MNESAGSADLVRKADWRFAKLRRERPDRIRAFGECLKRARKAGALSAKVKEPMNLAIAPATQCMPCVVRHARLAQCERVGLQARAAVET